MTEIRFYHLQSQPLEQALPRLLLKAYESGKKIVVRAGNETEVEKLNQVLWTFHPDAFLPHGSKKNGHAELQPIWLTEKDENPNDARILILTNGAEAADLTAYDLVCEVFNGFDDPMVQEARKRWKTYKEAGFTLTYWQQSESGKWEHKS